MLLRALCLLLALVAVTASSAGAQTQSDDLGELWQRYPLEAPPPEQRPAGAPERNGSLAGPPPKEARPAGVLPQVILFVALGLAVVGIAGGARQGIGWARGRRRGRLGAGAGDLGR
jgi:hypothetical protein